MKMKKLKYSILSIIVVFMLSACGSKGMSEKEIAEYIGGIKVVDLLDEKTYEQDGKKMVKALETMLNASPNDFHMLKQKPQSLLQLFSYASEFEETFKSQDCDYYYVGEMKDGKPHGYGVLTSSYQSTDMDPMKIYFIGEFKKGSVDNTYGVKLETCPLGTYIEYDGIIDYYSTKGNVVAADGKRTISNDLMSVHDNDFDYGSVLNGTKVAKCLPKYVGEIKDGNYSGEGVLYYNNGDVKYEGQFKKGSYHGKGKLYTSEGDLWKEGTFKSGELEKGNIYRE